MKSRELGQTGLLVSQVALGTWGLSGEPYAAVTTEEARRVISRSLSMGVTLFETSSSYGLGGVQGNGEMETALGELLGSYAAESGKDKSELTVITRVGTDLKGEPARKRFSEDFIEQAARAAQDRIGPGVNVVVLLHNPSAQAMDSGAGTAALKRLADDGIIKSWGVSAGNQAVAQAALDQGAPVLGLAYNVFQVEPLRALTGQISETKTAVVAHSVLSYGLLAAQWTPAKHFPQGDHRRDRWPEGSVRKRVQQLDALRPLVSGEVASIRSAALRFALHNDVISSVVLGPRTSYQLDQLLRDIQGEPPYLTDAKLTALESRLQQVGVRP